MNITTCSHHFGSHRVRTNLRQLHTPRVICVTVQLPHCVKHHTRILYCQRALRSTVAYLHFVSMTVLRVVVAPGSSRSHSSTLSHGFTVEQHCTHCITTSSSGTLLGTFMILAHAYPHTRTTEHAFQYHCAIQVLSVRH